MKIIVSLSLLLSTSSSYATSPTFSIENRVSKKSTHYTLSMSKDQQIECETQSTPKHRIQIKNWTRIEVPFKNGPTGANCEKTVTWGKVRRCYQRHENQILDDVIRWCTNI